MEPDKGNWKPLNDESSEPRRIDGGDIEKALFSTSGEGAERRPNAYDLDREEIAKQLQAAADAYARNPTPENRELLEAAKQQSLADYADVTEQQQRRERPDADPS